MTSDLTLLWVEDDPNDVFFFERALRKLGLGGRARFLRDGQEALDYLSGSGAFADRTAHPLPDLILLDLKLPRVSGFEVVTWLRSRPELRRIPVVVFTSSRERCDIDRAYDLGVNSYLVKPLSFEDLFALLKLLHGYWSGASRPSTIMPGREENPDRPR